MIPTDLLQRSVYSMTLEELKSLQEHYDSHSERYKHLERIDGIERAIKRLSEKKNDEPAWMEFAREDKETKRKWLSLGAKWHEWHSFTIWTYEGENFYQWSSGAMVWDEIHKLRQAEERLMQIINEKEQTNEPNRNYN